MAFEKKDAEKLIIVDKDLMQDSIKKLRFYHDGIVYLYQELMEQGADDEALLSLEDEASAIRNIINQLEDSIINVYTKTPQSGLH